MLKKGDFEPRSVLVWLIVGVFVSIVLIGLGNKIFSGISELNNKEICKRSVQQHALLHIRGVDVSSDIICPTNYIIIKEKNEEKIKKELANEMYDCWDNFGQGKFELFKDNTIYCSVCSVIEKFSEKKEIEGFGSYLLETNIPRKGITYYDFFAGYETSKAKEVVGKLTDEQRKQLDSEIIDTSRKYAVIFLYAKGKNEVEKVVNHVTGATPEGVVGGLGFAAGLGTFGAALLFVSGPVGWAIAGVGIVVAGVSVVGTYLLSYDNHPEWISVILLREYRAEELRKLGCKELPIGQKT